MLYRAIHTIAGEIRAATYVNDDTDLVAEAESYAASGLFVAPITAGEFPNAQAAVADDSYYIDYVGEAETPTLVASPPRPSEYYDFDFVTHTWVVSAERLAQAKQNKLAQLNAEFMARRHVPILFNGNPYSPTDEMVRDIRSFIESLEYFTVNPPMWEGIRSTNGGRTPTHFTWEDERDYLRGMLASMEQQRAKCLAVLYAHQDGIDAAATVEAVLGYDFTYWWPT